MERTAAELVMVLIGVTSAVLLVAWGVLASVDAGADPVFWILATAFLVYIAWDVRRHLRAIRIRGPPREGRNL